MVNAFRLDMTPDQVAPKLLTALEAVRADEDADTVRHALDDLSWSVLDATLGAAARPALTRSVKLVPHEHAMTPVHRRVMEAIKGHANAGLAPAGDRDAPPTSDACPPGNWRHRRRPGSGPSQRHTHEDLLSGLHQPQRNGSTAR